MFLSICIPTFNRLPYLKEAVGILLPQNLPRCDIKADLVMGEYVNGQETCR